MLYRNILLLVAGSFFVLAAGCSNDTAGSATAPLVASCIMTEDLEDLTDEDWLCTDEVFRVECEDGVGDPDLIHFWPAELFIISQPVIVGLLFTSQNIAPPP